MCFALQDDGASVLTLFMTCLLDVLSKSLLLCEVFFFFLLLHELFLNTCRYTYLLFLLVIIYGFAGVFFFFSSFENKLFMFL